MAIPQSIRADLHNHTYYSTDSLTSPERLVVKACQAGLDCIAVTDHNSIRAAEEIQAFAAREGLRVIIGEEVRSNRGEILGLFLNEEVPGGLSPDETMQRIKRQGGLVGIPHPYDFFRRSRLRRSDIERLTHEIDFFECLNARVMHSKPNREALQMAREWDLPMSAGSDAHSEREVGRAYVEMPDFHSPASFLESLRAGNLAGRTSSPFIHIVSRLAVVRHKLSKRFPKGEAAEPVGRPAA